MKSQPLTANDDAIIPFRAGKKSKSKAGQRPKNRRSLPNSETLEQRIMMAGDILSQSYHGQFLSTSHYDGLTLDIRSGQEVTGSSRTGGLVGIVVQDADAARVVDPASVRIVPNALNSARSVLERKDLRRRSASLTIAEVSTGSFSLMVTPERGTSGAYSVRTYLVGDVDANGIVDSSDIRTIEQALRNRRMTVSQYPGADADLDGRITRQDLRLALQNLGASLQATLSNPQAFEVPASERGSVNVEFSLLGRESGYRNEFGIFLVDDANGRIGTLKPGDSGYLQAALAVSRSQLLFKADQAGGASATVALAPGQHFGTFLVANGTLQDWHANPGAIGTKQGLNVYLSFAAANADRYPHVLRMSQDGIVLGLEDLWHGGDRDHNDMTVRIEFIDPLADPTLKGITLALDPAFDSAPVGDGITNIDRVDFVGRIDLDPADAPAGGYVVTLTGPTGTVLGSTSTSSDGSYRFQNIPLTLGVQDYSVRVADKNGNARTATLRLEYCGFGPDLTSQGWTTTQTGGTPGDQGTVTVVGDHVRLVEGDSFQVVFEKSFVIPADGGMVGFEYANLAFDTSAPGFINDAFEVALLGDNGQPLVPTFTPGRDAFFNVTEGLNIATGTGVILAGSQVMLDLAGQIPGTTARLVFRLVNNDADTLTSVEIVCAKVPATASIKSGRTASSASVPADVFAARTTASTSAGTASSGTVSISASPLGEFGPQALSPLGDTLLDDQGRAIFTTSDDFRNGFQFNLNLDEVPGEIRINAAEEATFEKIIWIANSGEGTVSKFDTSTGKELGRYRTGPSGISLYPNRTGVTSRGDVWVNNRDQVLGTMVKILNADFIDRNGNGIIDTSTDRNGDGKISGDEIMPWDANGDGLPDDERIAMSIPVGWNRNAPSHQYGSAMGRSLAIDANDNVWIGFWNAQQYEQYDGETGERKALIPVDGTPYNSVVDANGILWGTSSQLSSTLIRIDTVSQKYVGSIPDHNGRGIAIDQFGIIWFGQYDGFVLRHDPVNNTWDRYSTGAARNASGVAIDKKGRVWAGCQDGIVRLTFAEDRRTLVDTTYLPLTGPTTAAVFDADGYFWTTSLSSNKAYKIDPETVSILNGFPIETGREPYNYTNNTAAVRASVTGRDGRWTEILDGGRPGVPWATVSLLQDLPPETSSRLRVRASDDRNLLPAAAWQELPHDTRFEGIVGRYLEVEVALRSRNPQATPSIQEIYVQSVPLPTVEVELPAEIAAGTSLVLSGLATAAQPVLPSGAIVRNAITHVTVNGKPVDLLDSAGRFFMKIEVLPGVNRLEVAAYDIHGQAGISVVEIEGTQRAEGEVDFSNLSDITASFAVEYARTSFFEDDLTIFADVAVRNVGQYPVDAPLYVAITNLSRPDVMPRGAKGYTPDGLPFYDVSDLVPGGRLGSQSVTDTLAFAFFNPNESRFTYDLKFFGLLNRAPQITTVPVVEAFPGRTYSYDVNAVDPDGDPVRFALVTAPASMTIDPVTGVISWTPSETELGAHPLVVRADDGRGGFTEQRFTIDVTVAPPNRPPVFTSLPVVSSYVGVRYVYDADAVDPDGDTLRYAFAGTVPNGMTIDEATGHIAWTPGSAQQGEARVTIEATDGFGGVARQTYDMCVLAAPGNSAPVIVSQPVTTVNLVSTDNATPFDLGTWTAIDIPNTFGNGFNQDPSGDWIVDQSGTRVEQRVNASATILLSDQILESSRVEGTWRVSDTGLAGFIDNDFMGFVFGYQDPQHFYLFDWRQEYEVYNPFGAVGQKGMSIKRVNADSPLGVMDLWNTTVPGDRVVNLFHNSVPWVNHTEYQFVLETRPGQFTITVSQGATILESVTVDDDTYSSGRFGFYNYSQGQVHYSGFTQQSLVGGDYRYDVEAIDPDPDDVLTYSLVAGPEGMTIDPSTGLIDWKVPNQILAGLQGTPPTVGLPTIAGFRTEVYADNVITPAQLTFDSQGNLFAGGELYKISGHAQSPTRVFKIASGGGSVVEYGDTLIDDPDAIVYDRDGIISGAPGSILVGGANFNNVSIGKISAIHPDQSVHVLIGPSSAIRNPANLQIDSRGRLLFSQVGLQTQIAAFSNGLITTVIRNPVEIWDFEIGENNQIYVSSTDGVIRVYDLDGNLLNNTFATGFGRTTKMAAGPGGVWGRDLYVADSTNGKLYRVNAKGEKTIIGENFSEDHSWDFVFGPDKSMYISDYENDRILKISSPYSTNVSVRVEDGRGGFDVQNFEIRVETGKSSIEGTLREIGQTVVLASSTFDTDLGGWTSTAPQHISWRNDSGNPDGYLFWGDRTYYDPWVDAPDSFHGDWSALDGNGRIDYDQKLTFDGGRGGPFVYMPHRVQISGPGGSALWTGSTPTGLIPWTTISVPIEESAWTVSQGTWSSILENVTSFRIYGELVGNNDGGHDETGLDNVRLISNAGIGLQGWQVFVDANENGRYDTGEPSTLTDSQGNYRFSGLAMAAYSVSVATKPGWRMVDPAAGGYVFNLGSDEAVSRMDFGFAKVGAAPNRDPSFVTTPTNLPEQSVGSVYRYDANATDPDGDPITFSLPAAPAGMTVHPTLGVVVWAPTADQVGVHQVVLRVQDDKGGVALQNFAIEVAALNAAPVVSSTPPGPATVGLPYEYRIQAQDAEGDALSFRLLSPLGSNLSLSPDGVLRFTPVAGQVGDVAVKVAVDAAAGPGVEYLFTVPVVATSTNAAPVIRSTPGEYATLGMPFAYQILADDANGDPLTYELVDGPADMTINNGYAPEGSLIDAPGLVVWQPDAQSAGTVHAVVLRVSDGRGGVVTQEFAIEVRSQGSNLPPKIVSVPLMAATVDRGYKLDMKAVDPDGDVLSWILAKGPRGMSIDPRLGTLRWTPSADQLGPQEVVVEVIDPFMQKGTQRFTVVVTCRNQGPQILSRPVTVAYNGEPYVYAVRADDPENDVLSFRFLSTVPQGMTIDPKSGLIRWTPSVAAATAIQVAIEVSDGQGNVATQSYILETKADPRNRPPVITSLPRTGATAGGSYEYQVTTRDADGDTLRYELVSGPAGNGMAIDEKTGLLTWSPTMADLGEHVVTLAAIDSNNARALQTYLLKVAVNQAPSITSAPVTVAPAGGTYGYDVRAVDPDGDAVSYTLAKGPAGMTVDNLGRIRWQPSATYANLNPEPVEIVVSDPQGLQARQAFAVTVVADTEAPRVNVTFSTNLSQQGDTVRFRIMATDNVGVVSMNLTLGGQPLVLDSGGFATSVMAAPGVYPLVGTATDAAGNVGTWGPFDIRVFDPGDQSSPVVTILSPDPAQPNTTITYLTEIRGSVTDDNLEFWSLDFARADKVNLDQLVSAEGDDFAGWTNIASGRTNVGPAVLGTFDPTVLLNGPYVIRLMGQDVNGLKRAEVALVNVAGEAKIGNFAVEFTDLQVPLAGIPITVVRSYDTLKAGDEGDFGYGWSLGLRDARILESAAIGEGGAFTPGNDKLIPGYSKVYLTNPEGRRVGFTYREQLISASWFGGIWRPYFEADPGVYDTLTIDEKEVARGGIIGALAQGINPDIYTLTTPNGTKYRYDQNQGLQRIDTLNGQIVTFSKDGILHSSGARIAFARDHRGRITEIVQYDFQGNRVGEPVKYSYDAAGDLRTVTDQAGLTTSYVYETSPAHFLKEAFDSNNVRVLKVEYLNNRFVKVVDALGNTIDQRDYDLESRTAIIRDANGNETKLIYDDLGNVITETDALGKSIVREYADPKNPTLETKIIDKLGNVTESTYDARGNITTIRETGKASAPLADPVLTTFSYDTKNNVTSITNDLGRATTLGYDTKGNLLTITNAQGHSSRFTYDSQGRTKTFTDFNENTTTYEYKSEDCGCGAPGKIIFADGTYQLLKYNQYGQVTEDALYEPDGRLVEITQTQYDALGRETEITRGLGADAITTRMVYKNDRLDYEMVVNTASPNEARNTPVAQRKSRITAYDYDAAGRTIRQINPDGGIVEFRYDAAGNRVLLMDPVGNVTTWVYDALNRVAEERDPFYWSIYTENVPVGQINIDAIVTANMDPSGASVDTNTDAAHVRVFGYDAEGNRTEMIDRNGRRREFEYDHAGRMIEERWYEGTSTTLLRTMTWRYDTLGNLTEAFDPDSHYRYTYDTLNRVTSVDNNPLDTLDLPRVILSYKYDKQSNVISTSDNFGVTVASEYDKRNRLAVRTWFDATPGKTPDVDPVRIDFAYNAAGRQTVLDRRASLDKTAQIVARTTTTYYTNGLTNVLRHADAVDAVLASYEYGYDFGGLVVTEDRVHQDPQYRQTIEYGYDLNGQLIKADFDTQADEFYVYDLNGNRISSTDHLGQRTYTIGLANQLLSDSKFSFEYDDEGNMVEMVEIGTGQINNGADIYQYDPYNRLISVTHKESSIEEIDLVNNKSIAFYFDVNGYRVGATVQDDSQIPNTTEKQIFVNDRGNLWLKKSGPDAQLERLLFSDTIDSLIVSDNSNLPQSWNLEDLVGSTRDIIRATEYVVEHVEYSAFGEPLTSEVTTNQLTDGHGFSGRSFDRVSETYFMRARHYNPSTGIFISGDPLGLFSRQPMSSNLYAYVGNQPISDKDPFGLVSMIEYKKLSKQVAVNGTRCVKGFLTGEMVGAVAELTIYMFLASNGQPY